MSHLTKSDKKVLKSYGYTESQILQASLKAKTQPLRRVTNPEELRAFGIDVDGEMVISVGQPRRKSCP